MTQKDIIIQQITALTALSERTVGNTLTLLEEGCTIPFISRYRKEKTGGLDEVAIEKIATLHEKFVEMIKRKTTILDTIREQGKLTDSLEQQIDNCWDATTLEDIYLPYKPKRKTRAQQARERGLEPLAKLLLLQRERQPEEAARRYVRGEVVNVDAALAGACDIIAEEISEDLQVRNTLRKRFQREATIVSTVVKTKKNEEGAAKYADYFSFEEPLKRCSGNRLLAMRRGEQEGFLRVKIIVDNDAAVEQLQHRYLHGNNGCTPWIKLAVEDAYKRLLLPSIENEFAAISREKAEEEAIHVFVNNLSQLLLAPPLGRKRILAVDPGIRTGCKVVVIDALGNLVDHTVVYLFPPQGDRKSAEKTFIQWAEKYHIEAVSVGNGTAGRETADTLKHALPQLPVYTVSEDGASVYSASAVAREEFPNHDVTVRGAVSIGRRLMDPLAELVKIDAKSIGVGQYQHDVDQGKLKKSLDFTVESCVNKVGVNVNTASKYLLTYVSGLGPVLAQNIISYRNEHGAFQSREELKKVARMGAYTFQQCAGFLRIPESDNPLDNTAVHPEAYPLIRKMAADAGCTLDNFVKDKERQKSIDLQQYVTEETGLPTLTDIMSELEKPGRDPRGEVKAFEFDNRVHQIEDVEVGMILPGIVTNITKFGVFVDIGVHQDGLVHVSQLANRFVSDPNEVVKLHEAVTVKVTEVDVTRKRIGLSMKAV